MDGEFFFPDEVTREIKSAAEAADATARIAHVELAMLHLQAGRDSPDDQRRFRQMVEAAVLARIAFADGNSGREPSEWDPDGSPRKTSHQGEPSHGSQHRDR
jgi:hypothetical protein